MNGTKALGMASHPMKGETALHIIATLYENTPEGLVNVSPGELASPAGQLIPIWMVNGKVL